ncbi:hypothetical protein ELOC111193_09275 [Elizabethkingia occulta]|uniref:Lipoprotein n=1 Tax=Elizabethkingia occulta TaxID=1867263 RepID=A0A1T3MP09_9FLAO|nr:hypothetical protein [Elizabethkingia occulta]OPC66284.1 hypothetical protein BAZ10_03385 [Elizabethkingia occulta]
MMKSIIYYIVIFGLIISCQTKKVKQDIDIIENIPFSKNNFYKYDNGYLRNNPQKLDSSRSYIYTIIEPSDENRKYPRKIYTLISINRDKETSEYFYKKLKGENLSFIEMNNKIVFRDFYRSYIGKEYHKSDINKPRNKEDLIKYLKSKNAKYKILSIGKSEKADVVKAKINNSFYEIVVDSTFCKSYLYYNEKDTIFNYSTVLFTFF